MLGCVWTDGFGPGIPKYTLAHIHTCKLDAIVITSQPCKYIVVGDRCSICAIFFQSILLNTFCKRLLIISHDIQESLCTRNLWQGGHFYKNSATV